MESGILVGFFPDRSVAGGDTSDSEMPGLLDPAEPVTSDFILVGTVRLSAAING